MNLALEGRTVIVTGGSAGIGGAIALALAEEGARPVIFDRSPLKKDFHSQLFSRQPQSLSYSVELADEAACSRAVADVIRQAGEIYGLVNNAGRNDGVELGAGAAAFRGSLEQNLVHYYTMASLCVGHIKASRGSIVNISSKIALTGQGQTSGYAAAKGAQLALTREWAAELAADGVRVNAVVPAEVLTPLYASWLTTFDEPSQKLEQIESHIPLGQRLTAAEEIAQTVVFLLSKQSSHTTGQFLVVDGGYVHLDRSLTMRGSPSDGASP